MFDKDKPVLTKIDKNVAGKETGYIVYYQIDGPSVVYDNTLASLLRQNGYVVQNNLV